MHCHYAMQFGAHSRCQIVDKFNTPTENEIYLPTIHVAVESWTISCVLQSLSVISNSNYCI